MFRAFFSPHVRKSKTVLDFGFRAVDSGFKLLDSPSLLSGSWIPDSGFLQLYSRFQGPGFQISQAKISRIPSHGEIFLYIFSKSFTSAQTGCYTLISFPEAAILRSATGMLVSLEKSNKGSGDEIFYANPSISSWHDL